MFDITRGWLDRIKQNLIPRKDLVHVYELDVNDLVYINLPLTGIYEYVCSLPIHLHQVSLYYNIKAYHEPVFSLNYIKLYPC